MFVFDFYGENGLMKVLDLKNKKIIKSFAYKGEGPNEVLSVGSFDCVSSEYGDFLYLFDPMTKKMQIYAMDSLLSDSSRPIPIVQKKMPSKSRYMEVLKTKNGYIASGIIEDKKFVLLNDSLQECGSGGQYAKKPSEDIPNMTNVIANNGKFFMSEDKKYIVNVIYLAGIISCYTFDDISNSISLKWENILTELDYTLHGESFVNNGTIGYLSAAMGKQYIYALYSGEKENTNENATYGAEIHIYDYEGTLIKKYKIPTPAFCICVDEENHTLYAVTHEPETAVIKYTLPEKL